MYKIKAASLQPYNSFGVDAMAYAVVFIENYDDVKNIFSQIDDAGPFVILGGGTNVLFTHDFYDGIVFINKLKGYKIVEENEHKVIYQISSGENWHDFVSFCVNNNLSGIENLALIPGSVGAAPIQNIGAYGAELQQVCKEVNFYNYRQKKFDYLNTAECKFGYRDSIFKNELKDSVFITSVTIELQKNFTPNVSYKALRDFFIENKNSQPTLAHIFDAVINIRNSKLPNYRQTGNAGSFFKNPIVTIDVKNTLAAQYTDLPFYNDKDGYVKISAAWLIEQCGWKGYKENNCGCYSKQSLVLVNYGNATGNDILNLSHKIKQSVLEKFDIELQTEVNII